MHVPLTPMGCLLGAVDLYW